MATEFKQMDLWENVNTSDADQTTSIDTTVNSLRGYGVNYDDLKCFRGKGEKKFDMNYNILGQIWRGLNYAEDPDLHLGVPNDILSNMNTSEILSLYRAFARLLEHGNVELKRKGDVRERITKSELKEMNCEEVISKMVGYGCQHRALNTMRNRGYTGFSTKPYALKNRIKGLPDNVKDTFLALLNNTKREMVTDLNQGRFGVFFDPCYDASKRRIKGYLGRRKYCESIVWFMNELSEYKKINSL